MASSAVVSAAAKPAVAVSGVPVERASRDSSAANPFPSVVPGVTATSPTASSAAASAPASAVPATATATATTKSAEPASATAPATAAPGDAVVNIAPASDAAASAATAAKRTAPLSVDSKSGGKDFSGFGSSSISDDGDPKSTPPKGHQRGKSYAEGLEEAKAHAKANGSPVPTSEPLSDRTRKVDEVVRKVFGLKPIRTGTKRGLCSCCRVEIDDEVRMISWVVFAVFAIIAGAFLIADLALHKVSVEWVYDNYSHGVSLLISGTFMVSSVYVSIVLIRGHQRHYFHPESQQQVIRILWMVPVYSVCSFFSLILIDLSPYIDFIRACYEAFVIYSFMILLTTYLGGHGAVTDVIMSLPKPHWPHWPAPLCCFRPVTPSKQFLWYLKYGALQYVYLVPLVSVTAIVCDFFGVYHDGEFAWDHGYSYCAFVMNMSQLIALYVLAWLYICCKNELAPFRPMSKFLVVKAVVFMTFWQSVTISLLVKIGWITPTENFSAGELNMSLQNFLVCIEMFLAAAAHKYTFGFETYKDGSMLVLMEVRKELREAKRALEKAGFEDLEPGQSGPQIALDEHGHPVRPAAQPGAPDGAAPGAAGASDAPNANAGGPAGWKPLPGTPEALVAIGQGFVEFGGAAKEATMAGAKKVRDFTHQILKADDIF